MDRDNGEKLAREGAEELRSLVATARNGDAAAMAAVRSWLDRHPQAWREAGDVAACAERAWVELVAGPDPLAREAVRRALEAMGAELAGPEEPPAVRLLARRAALCWLQAQHADYLAARLGDAAPVVARDVRERQDRAHRRHLSSLAELERLRLLGVGAIASGRESRDVPEADGDALDRAERRLTSFGAG